MAVERALEAASIRPERRGRQRTAPLLEDERELFLWILRRFATTGGPSSAETREVAARLGLDVERAFDTFAREDLVQLDGDGKIVVAYPFSGRPTAHRVRFPSGHEAYAMCAIDALGIAPMFAEPIEIASQDPLSGDEIRARVTPDADAESWPEGTVVVSGALDRLADACSSCCPVLNFFASSKNAERWLGEHSEVRGEVISVQDAALAGRAVFGEVLAKRR